MATMTVELPDDLAREFRDFCADVGLTVSAAFNALVGKAMQDKAAFESDVFVPNETTLNAIQEIEAMKADPLLGKRYTDMDAMMAEILAESDDGDGDA